MPLDLGGQVFEKLWAGRTGCRTSLSIAVNHQQELASVERVFEVSQRDENEFLHAHLSQRTKSETER